LVYRTDIDGLRAIAVSLVVIFHINETLVPGGFVGVDMFFVISGYLITGIILRDVEAGQFSYAEFYRRRAKRIFPAVFVVTLTTLLVGAWVLLPDDMVALSESALATMLFAANIFFTAALDTSYFAADSRTVPLLHMWSLGVEEQFYLIWPALLLVVLKWPRWGLPVVGLLCVLSIVVGELALRAGWFSFAYYMLPTRAFQLMAGAALILAERSGRFALWPGGTLFVGLVGLGMVIGSAFVLHGDTAYPGLRAAPVTVGTLLLLMSGSGTHALASLLSLKPIRWIGLVSFSLYLWHWPVLAFQRYLTPDFGWGQQALSLIVMLALSQLTYSLVEQPFRTRAVTFRAALRRYWVYPGLCIGALGLAHIASDGYGVYTFTDLKQRIESQGQPAYRLPFVCQSARLTPDKITKPDCVLGADGPVKTLLLGDSNAAHFVGAFDEVARAHGFRFRNVAHSACPPVTGDTRPFTLARYDDSCTASRALVETQLADYHTIILAASWDVYAAKTDGAFLQALSATLEAYLSDGKTIVIVGVAPRQPGFDRQCMIKKLKQSWISCSDASADPKIPEINTLLKDMAAQTPGLWYLEPYDPLCHETGCPTREGDKLLYFDGSHLSQFGSRQAGLGWLEDDKSNAVLRQVFGRP